MTQKDNKPTSIASVSMTNDSIENKTTTQSGITRKEAIKRMGKYAAVTAIGSYIILNPMKAQAQSSPVGDSTPANPNTSGQSLFD